MSVDVEWFVKWLKTATEAELERVDKSRTQDIRLYTQKITALEDYRRVSIAELDALKVEKAARLASNKDDKPF